MSAVYYPGCAVVFTLRFDELLLNGKVPPPKNAQELATPGINDIIGPPSPKIALLSGAADRLSKKVGVIPKTASFELPGYRQAPKFNMTLAWRDLPLDPRAVRALGVEIYVGSLSADQFSRNMLFKDSPGLAASLLTSPDNLILAGTCDSIDTGFDEHGSVLTLEGRGLQGIFLDARIHNESLLDLPVVQPIGALVEALLARAGMGGKVPVEVEAATEWPGGKEPQVATQDVVTRVNKGRDGNKAEMPTKGDSSTILFWDLVVNFCFLVGAVPYFEGHTLRIRPAVNLYQRQAQAKLGKTPFLNSKPRTVRTDKGSEQFSLRRMVYGSNLLNFRLSRKLAGSSKLPTIRVVCNDPDAETPGKGQVLEAQWPPKDAEDKQKTSSVAPNGGESKEELMTIPVYGIKDITRLTQIAHALYEEICRNEISGSASTKDLASLGGGNGDTDLLRLRPGDPVEFLVDATGLRGFPPIVSDANLLASQSPEEATRLLAEQLGDRDLAALIVGTSRGQFQGLQDFFHVQTVKYGWAVESGIAVDFDFQNYVEARYEDATGLAEFKGVDTSFLDPGSEADYMTKRAAIQQRLSSVSEKTAAPAAAPGESLDAQLARASSTPFGGF